MGPAFEGSNRLNRHYLYRTAGFEQFPIVGLNFLIPFVGQGVSNDIAVNSNATSFTVPEQDLYYIYYKLVLNITAPVRIDILIDGNPAFTHTNTPPSNPPSIISNAYLVNILANQSISIQLSGYNGELNLLSGTELIIISLNTTS